MSETMGNVTEKAEETKAEKFIRLREYLINKAIDAIGRIEDLATKAKRRSERARNTNRNGQSNPARHSTGDESNV